MFDRHNAVSALADKLAIDAFDKFRSATGHADLPLPFINAVAAYKSAVDFTLLAAFADASGQDSEVERLVGWAYAILLDMEIELAALSTAGSGANVDYPAP